jgi:lysophospholipase L1-like esterase
VSAAALAVAAVGKRWRSRVLVLLAAALAATALSPSDARAADRVLVLSTTLAVGDRSPEIERIRSLGLEPEVATPDQWLAKSAVEFSAYRALVLGDASCAGDPHAAEVTARVWGPQVDGNVMVVGTDPVFHDDQGGRRLTDAGIAYATDRPGKTGAYIALSCYFHGSPSATPVPLLDGLSRAGGFTVRGVGCYDQAHVTATDRALTGLVDATLSGWNCSVHEAFDEYPSDFLVLAIARDVGATYTAPDGSVGTPYVLARGSGTWYRGRTYVALGDSVAAGEGIAYEFSWSPFEDRWVRKGPADPDWDSTYTSERCHQAPAAHPRTVSLLLGAEVLHLACTGASARDGVLGDRHGDGWSAPAQLGSSLPGFAPPNPRYDAAAPDIITLSLGANDVDFADRVAACYEPALGGCDTDPDQLDGPLAAQRRDLDLVLDEIRRRAPGGKAPFTVLTEYVDPFPAEWTDSCPDLDVPVPFTGLSKRELDFLRGGLERLNANLRAAAESHGAVALPPPASFAAHPFCSGEPWTFGPSIRTNDLLGPDSDSPAPFHPTVAGQDEIARAIASLVRLKLPVYPGSEVTAELPQGDLIFDAIERAGEVAIIPESLGIGALPPASSFRKAAGYEVVSSASFSGSVSVSLPASQPLSLFHFVDARWVEVPSSYENGRVTGRVGSLSPFALGTPVSPVTARIDHSAGGIAPVAVAFSAAGSSVADGGAVASYRWDFGDRSTANGPVPSHVYDQSGAYKIRLEVTAANGAVDTATATVRVTNEPPVAAVDAPAEGVAGEPVAFASTSRDSNGSVAEWAWDFGDGSEPGTGARAEHTFRRPGTYEVRLQVADDEGEEASVAVPVRITAQRPSGPAGPDSQPGSAARPGSPDAPRGERLRRARLTLVRGLRWDIGGRLLVRARCAAGRQPCRGVVTVRRGHRRLAAAKLRAAAGTRLRLRLRARGAVARRLRTNGARVVVRARLADGQVTAFSTRLAAAGSR